MVSDAIKKQVAAIQEGASKRLQELPVLVLLLQVTFFIDYWFSRYFAHATPLLRLIDEIIMGLIAGLLLISIVSYFWRVQNRPHFHVVFIRRKEEQRQTEARNFLTFSLIPVGISVGLSLFLMLCYWLSDVYLSPPLFSEHVVDFWWTPYNTNESLVYYPLLFIVFFLIGLLVSLYFVYRIIPGIRAERIQRSFPLLLFVAIGASISVLVSQLVGYLSDLMQAAYNITPFFEIARTEANVTFFSLRALFLASFVVLFYLTYRINADYKRTLSPPVVEGGYARRCIEGGVVILPERVRVGDSFSISLDLTLSDDLKKRASYSGDSYKPPYDYLDAELQAPGLTVDGEKRLKISETSSIPNTWNCYFAKSGTNSINLLINAVRSPTTSRDGVFMLNHAIKVNSFLSTQIAPVLILIAPILAAVVQVLLKGGI